MRFAILLTVGALFATLAPASAQAVKRTVTQNELKNLQIYMEFASADSGKLPDKEAIMASLKMEKGAANLVKAIEEGVLVLTGTNSREEVWAYEKDITVKGGLMLSSNGIERLDAAAAKKKRLGK